MLAVKGVSIRMRLCQSLQHQQPTLSATTPAVTTKTHNTWYSTIRVTGLASCSLRCRRVLLCSVTLAFTLAAVWQQYCSHWQYAGQAEAGLECSLSVPIATGCTLLLLTSDELWRKHWLAIKMSVYFASECNHAYHASAYSTSLLLSTLLTWHLDHPSLILVWYPWVLPVKYDGLFSKRLSIVSFTYIIPIIQLYNIF